MDSGCLEGVGCLTKVKNDREALIGTLSNGRLTWVPFIGVGLYCILVQSNVFGKLLCGKSLKDVCTAC